MEICLSLADVPLNFAEAKETSPSLSATRPGTCMCLFWVPPFWVCLKGTPKGKSIHLSFLLFFFGGGRVT